MTILPTAYFPPVSYISLLAKGDVFLEAHENYQKQSWRNRCLILTANGPEALNVPVVHSHDSNPCGTFRIPIREIRIDWSRDWLTRHKRAIDSAYMSSTYFEHYRNALYGILDRRPELLWDLNLSIIEWFSEIWHLPAIGQTSSFMLKEEAIHPKREDKVYVLKPYWQVFGEKFPFAANMSAMDLLFNEGPQGKCYL